MSYPVRDDGFERVDGFDEPPPYAEVSPEDEARKRKEKVGFQSGYIRTVPGMLKILQIATSLIAFICTLAGSWIGVGFASWVTVSAFLTTSLLFVVHAFNIYPRLPGFWPLYELIYLILYTLKYLITVIICAVGAAISPAAIVAVIVCLVALGVYILDTYMQYKRFKEAREDLDRQRESGEGSASRRGGDSFCIIF